jgi:hypothetical protein
VKKESCPLSLCVFVRRFTGPGAFHDLARRNLAVARPAGQDQAALGWQAAVARTWYFPRRQHLSVPCGSVKIGMEIANIFMGLIDFILR